MEDSRVTLTGLDLLLLDPGRIRGRRYGLLAHAASLSAEAMPAHLALLGTGASPPSRLFAPEHGFWGVEQDMIPALERHDPLTGLPVTSLYGEDASSLAPRPEVFSELDLLLIDLQDVGCRFYTYAATAVWAAEVALSRGCEVWVLDRPNPLGGERVEGNLRREGFESFVGAFELPVRHGLTLGELVLLEAGRRGWPAEGLQVVAAKGWSRSAGWLETGRPWVAPSPNMPTPGTALLYPGLCLVEGTTLSEGRGTTRPFQLVGAPDVDPVAVAEALAIAAPPGVRCTPTLFRPQFQKHTGELCGGVELIVTDPSALSPFRLGVAVLAAFRKTAPETFEWRHEPYEFVTDRPAIDLLAGDDGLRLELDAGGDGRSWIEGWAGDEEAFRIERRPSLLYPEGGA